MNSSRKTRFFACISLLSGVIACFYLLMLMASLQENYYGAQPYLTVDRQTIHFGLPVILLVHIVSVIALIRSLDRLSKQS